MVTKLRQLSKSCNFGTLNDSLLRDKIVLGVKDKSARARMFREKAVDVNGAIDQLRASEITAQQIREIEQGHTKESIQFAKKEKPKRSKGGTSKIKCVFCLQMHEFGRDNCPAYGSTCRAIKRTTGKEAKSAENPKDKR